MFMKQKCLMVVLILFLAGSNVFAKAEDIDADVMKADANNDGKVSFDEYKTAHEKSLLERFKLKDVNKDGYIDLEEKIVDREKVQAKEKAENEEEINKLREQFEEERIRRKKHFFKY
jgi:DNA polymerase elongation subunit (family B)